MLVGVLIGALGGAPASAMTPLRVQTVELHAAPIALAFAYRRLWVVAERPAGPAVVLRIDGASAPAPTIVASVGRPGPDMGAIAAGNGFLWATAGTRLARISPTPPYRTLRAALPGEASGVAVGAGRVWVATVGARDLLLGLDSRTLRIERRIRLPSAVSRLAFGLGSLWTVDERGVARIDARTGRRTPIGLVGAAPSAIALAGGKAWVYGGPGIVAVSATGREEWDARLPVHGGAFVIGGSVAWATDDCGCSRGTLVGYDPRRRHVLARVSTGTTPDAIAATAHAAWVANFESGTLTNVRR